MSGIIQRDLSLYLLLNVLTCCICITPKGAGSTLSLIWYIFTQLRPFLFSGRTYIRKFLAGIRVVKISTDSLISGRKKKVRPLDLALSFTAVIAVCDHYRGVDYSFHVTLRISAFYQDYLGILSTPRLKLELGSEFISNVSLGV
ncbi:hypothetical protein DFS33DRAFT_1278070 [Desarmillaria ectypa]|nr:hypothetical protein DFS33DRAFT_1278070 [Desarmillaria ectypa]